MSISHQVCIWDGLGSICAGLSAFYRLGPPSSPLPSEAERSFINPNSTMSWPLGITPNQLFCPACGRGGTPRVDKSSSSWLPPGYESRSYRGDHIQCTKPEHCLSGIPTPLVRFMVERGGMPMIALLALTMFNLIKLHSKLNKNMRVDTTRGVWLNRVVRTVQ